MSVKPIEPDRALRRRHKHERQAVVFGVLVAGLAVAALASVAVFTGTIAAPFARDFKTIAPDSGPSIAAAPCPPDGTLPVAYPNVQINVLNAAKVSGLAAQTAAALTERGFVVLTRGNSPATVTGVARISFGAQGIGAAYTLAAQLPEPVLAFDARADATVDLAVGTTFEGLRDAAEIALDPAVPLQGQPGCVALADAVPAPAPVVTPAAPVTPAAG